MPREGEGGGDGGGGFWQSVINYFGSCDGGGGGGGFRRIIPPTIDTKIPDGETDKQGITQKEDGIDRKPSKPFYYVLPPTPGFNYYFPQPNLFNQPNLYPKYISTNAFRTPNAKSFNVQNTDESTEIPSHVEISNGHANEKNVN